MKRLTDKSVFVYFNLHRKLWSIKSRKTGRVLAHTDKVVLKDAEFRVGQAGRRRVLEERRKNVHAGVAGEWVDSYSSELDFDTPVTYNPYKYETFVKVESETPVKSAEWVDLNLASRNKVCGIGVKS